MASVSYTHLPAGAFPHGLLHIISQIIGIQPVSPENSLILRLGLEMRLGRHYNCLLYTSLCSLHYYFFSLKFTPEPVRALALTEFGGYSWKIPGHSYSEKLYGYGKYDSRQALTEGYRKLLTSTILPAVEKGISATIYTQLSDVEEEVNGLYTYDREILKPDKETVIQLNQAMKDIVNRTGAV